MNLKLLKEPGLIIKGRSVISNIFRTGIKKPNLFGKGKTIISERLKMRANRKFLFEDKVKVKNRNIEKILISLIVVAMVGGTFFYLFQTRDFERTALGGVLTGLIADFVTERIENNAGEEGVIDNEEEKTQDKEYQETALSGEGLTHVARRTLIKHIEEKEIVDLSAEHRIYIEDYIQKKLGSRTLDLGEKITISQDLISEAINSSRELNGGQLNNLKQYSALVLF